MREFSTPNNDEIERCFNALEQSKEIVVDVETSGLDKHRNFICGYVFTVGPKPEDNFYLPVRHRDGGNIPGCPRPKHPTDFRLGRDDHPVEKRIRSIADRPDKHWIGHNIKYDMWMAARHGIFFEGTVEDTMVNAALIDEMQGKFSLDFCAMMMDLPGKEHGIYDFIKNYMGNLGVKVPEDPLKRMEFFWCTPGDGVSMKYALQDGDTTFSLVHAQRVEMEKQELDRVWGVEKRVTKTLFRMEYRGIPVDEEKLDKVEGKLKILLDEAECSLPDGMNVNSGPQVKKYLEDRNITDWPTTPKGNPSFPEDYLENFPEGEKIISVRKVSNLLNTFINGSVRGHLFKGKVHCNLNQTKREDYGVVSGRLSSSDPNMQQIPKRHKILAPMLRQVYRSPYDEIWWWSADFKSQEYRVFAEYAASKMVLAAYEEDPDTDYHQLVADMLGVERDPAAKRINLGTIYNMGAPSLAAKLKVSVRIARGYYAKMHQMMPEAKDFNKMARTTAKTRGYVFTKLGRRRRFPDPRFAHKAGNAIIQGSSADMTKVKMVETDEYLVGEKVESQLILQVHDSLEFMYHKDEEKHMNTCMEIMQSFGEDDIIQFEVPMRLDIAKGESWGHATFPKYDDWV